MKYFIYQLIDPNNNEIRYVGQTINIKQRYNRHISDSFRKNTHLYCWIKSLIKDNKKPIIEVIEECDIDCIDIFEKMYISLYKSWGVRLTNLDSGGQKNRGMSNETKQKISLSLTGKKQSDETKLKRKNSLIETYKNEDLRKLKSEQSKYLYSLGLISRKGCPSNKKGTKLTEDTKLKLSNSLKEYYKTNSVHNKIFLDESIINNIINDYKNNICEFALTKKYKLSRSVIKRLVNEYK